MPIFANENQRVRVRVVASSRNTHTLKESTDPHHFVGEFFDQLIHTDPYGRGILQQTYLSNNQNQNQNGKQGFH